MPKEVIEEIAKVTKEMLLLKDSPEEGQTPPRTLPDMHAADNRDVTSNYESANSDPTALKQLKSELE